MDVMWLVINSGKITYKQVANHMIEKLRQSNDDVDEDQESLGAADEEDEDSEG